MLIPSLHHELVSSGPPGTLIKSLGIQVDLSSDNPLYSVIGNASQPVRDFKLLSPESNPSLLCPFRFWNMSFLNDPVKAPLSA